MSQSTAQNPFLPLDQSQTAAYNTITTTVITAAASAMYVDLSIPQTFAKLQERLSTDPDCVIRLYRNLLQQIHPRCTETQLLRNIRNENEYTRWPSRVFQEALIELVNLKIVVRFNDRDIRCYKPGPVAPR